jgi:hypothetical protein
MEEDDELTAEYQSILSDISDNKDLDIHFFTIRERLNYLNNKIDELNAKNQENPLLLRISYDYYRLQDILLAGNAKLKLKNNGFKNN